LAEISLLLRRRHRLDRLVSGDRYEEEVAQREELLGSEVEAALVSYL